MKRRGCEQDFLTIGHCIPDGIGNLVCWLIDVPQAVGFVYDDEIPRCLLKVGTLRSRKLKGAKNNARLIKRVEIAPFYVLVEGLAFQNGRRKKNLSSSSWLHCFRRFAGQITSSFRRRSAQRWEREDSRLDRLSKADFVSEYRATRKRRAKSKEGRFDLMWVQGYLSIC